ncbi:MAG: HTH domain-containing protein [Archangiaceae bacterium]|nr:HTH domain-containing protein [Archangiaceae bacterium]
MRASRLLRVLLLLQNRGRQTCAQLSTELEVARRTVLRDVEALTEAGLPLVVHRGARGGIELGFNYRTRLTGLSAAEAEALGVLLGTEVPMLEALGLEAAGKAARTKLLESLPDGVRETALTAQRRFRAVGRQAPREDPRVAPLAKAVRERRKVRIRARSVAPQTIHPVALVLGPQGWLVEDGLQPGRRLRLADCGDLNISALQF